MYIVNNETYSNTQYSKYIKEILIKKYPNLRHRKRDIKVLLKKIKRLIDSEVFNYKTNLNLQQVVDMIEYEFNIAKENENQKNLYQDYKIIINNNLKEINTKIKEIKKYSEKEDLTVKSDFGSEIAPIVNPDLPLKKLDTKINISNLIESLRIDLYYEMGFLQVLEDLIELSNKIIKSETNLSTNIEEYNNCINKLCFFDYDLLYYLIEQTHTKISEKDDFKLSDKIFIKSLVKNIIIASRNTIEDKILAQCPKSKDKNKILNQFINRIQVLIDSGVFDNGTTNSLKNTIWKITISSSKKSIYVNDFVMFLYQNKIKFKKTALKNYKEIITHRERICTNPLNLIK